MTEAMPELTSLLGHGTVRRLVKLGKVKVIEVAILWVKFIITILKARKKGPHRDRHKHLAIPQNINHENKGVLEDCHRNIRVPTQRGESRGSRDAHAASCP